ncbi:hypothetical protein [Embleya scabrispora]|uniref:hypothetical protein n=1 Tax=Embleya scabrispora TaxID=159449 RepID=UPI00035DE8B2|nr:hypothetical protein [Embleya scabrispora]MYS87391.1 hypothetical protein [Streptomyces sp. SID5474]
MKLPNKVDALDELTDATEFLSPARTAAAVRRLAAVYPHTALPAIYEKLVAVRRCATSAEPGYADPDGSQVDPLTKALALGIHGWSRHDLGDTREALATTQAGVLSAVVDARDPSAEVWLRGVQSLIAYRAGWVHEALRYARLGASVHDPEVGTASVWLHSLVALTQATLGDALAASAALRAAADARELSRRDELDEIGGLLLFDPARQSAYEALTRVFIPGAERRAIEAAESTLSSYEAVAPSGYSRSDEMLARVAIALAYASLDEIEATTEALRPVFRLDSAWRVHGLISLMMVVHVRLRRPMRARETRVRELQEEIETFCQMPLSLDLYT